MECLACGELMTPTDPLELIWDYFPGSIEIRQLVNWGDSHPGRDVFACYGCGWWLPTL